MPITPLAPVERHRQLETFAAAYDTLQEQKEDILNAFIASTTSLSTAQQVFLESIGMS